MEKKYFADVYFYDCPECKKQTIGKHYYAIYALAEMGAAKGSGLVWFTCTHCGASYPSNRILVKGEVVEVSSKEALSHGLTFESKGSA